MFLLTALELPAHVNDAAVFEDVDVGFMCADVWAR